MDHKWYKGSGQPTPPPRIPPPPEGPKNQMIYDLGPPLRLCLGRFCQRRGWHRWAKRLMGLWTWNEHEGQWENPRQSFDIIDAEIQYRQHRKKMDL